MASFIIVRAPYSKFLYYIFQTNPSIALYVNVSYEIFIQFKQVIFFPLIGYCKLWLMLALL